MSPGLEALAAFVCCPLCGATAWLASGTQDEGALACATCGAVLPCVDGVLNLGEAGEVPGVRLEREAARRTERVPALGGIDETFDDLSRAEGALRGAIFALPYGDGSRYYEEPGYFANVRRSAPAFDFLVRHLAVRKGERLLDLGADLTWSTCVMARLGLESTAVDINHHLAVGRLLARHSGAPYHLVRADMSSASFRSGWFDIVLAINALHHAERLREVAANIARVLRPGGRLGFIEPYCSSEEAKATFGRAQIEAGITEQTYFLAEWHTAFVDAGLRVRLFRVADSFTAVYEKAPDGDSDLLAHFYEGELSAVNAAPAAVGPGLTFHVPISIQNTGNAVWTSASQFPVYASYHLTRRDDGMERLVAFENPRTVIREEVAPGHGATVNVAVTAPTEPGEYIAEIDLVHEYMSWFASKGMKSPRIRFYVGSSSPGST